MQILTQRPEEKTTAPALLALLVLCALDKTKVRNHLLESRKKLDKIYIALDSFLNLHFFYRHCSLLLSFLLSLDHQCDCFFIYRNHVAAKFKVTMKVKVTKRASIQKMQTCLNQAPTRFLLSNLNLLKVQKTFQSRFLRRPRSLE